MKKSARLVRFLFLSLAVSAAVPGAEPDQVEERKQAWFGSWTFSVENDALLGTDQNYTQGLRFTRLSRNLKDFRHPDYPVSTFLADKIVPRLAERFRDLAALRRGFSFGQNIYTPSNIHTAAFLPNDRPYTGWLYLGLNFHILRDGRDGRVPSSTVVEFTTGVIGPWALGRFAQNGWHDLWRWPRALGWGHQLRNELGVNFVVEQKRRYSTDGALKIEDVARTGFAVDAIPHYGYSLGTVSTYANAGAELRAGWRLPLDFGTPVIRASGDTAVEGTQGAFGWHVFGSCDARLVARDAFLDGNITRGGPHVSKRPFVADWQHGLAVNFCRLKLTYSEVRRTKEFHGQARRQAFSSIGITYSRPWDARFK